MPRTPYKPAPHDAESIKKIKDELDKKNSRLQSVIARMAKSKIAVVNVQCQKLLVSGNKNLDSWIGYLEKAVSKADELSFQASIQATVAGDGE